MMEVSYSGIICYSNVFTFKLYEELCLKIVCFSTLQTVKKMIGIDSKILGQHFIFNVRKNMLLLEFYYPKHVVIIISLSYNPLNEARFSTIDK